MWCIFFFMLFCLCFCFLLFLFFFFFLLTVYLLLIVVIKHVILALSFYMPLCVLSLIAFLLQTFNMLFIYKAMFSLKYICYIFVPIFILCRGCTSVKIYTQIQYGSWEDDMSHYNKNYSKVVSSFRANTRTIDAAQPYVSLQHNKTWLVVITDLLKNWGFSCLCILLKLHCSDFVTFSLYVNAIATIIIHEKLYKYLCYTQVNVSITNLIESPFQILVCHPPLPVVVVILSLREQINFLFRFVEYSTWLCVGFLEDKGTVQRSNNSPRHCSWYTRFW